jgi:hypothetical protein
MVPLVLVVKVGCRQHKALRSEKNRFWQVTCVFNRGRKELFIVFGMSFGACTGKGMHKKNAAQFEIWVPTEQLLCSSKHTI